AHIACGFVCRVVEGYHVRLLTLGVARCRGRSSRWAFALFQAERVHRNGRALLNRSRTRVFEAGAQRVATKRAGVQLSRAQLENLFPRRGEQRRRALARVGAAPELVVKPSRAAAADHHMRLAEPGSRAPPRVG